jgi:hypothetical protein
LVDATGISFFPELHNSTATTIPQTFVTSALSLGPCIAGSTLTLTTSGGQVELAFFGTVGFGGSATTNASLGVLQDGVFLTGFSSATAVAQFTVVPTNGAVEGSFHYLLAPPSAGEHSYCVSLAGDSAGVYIGGDSGTARFGSQFIVEEIK